MEHELAELKRLRAVAIEQLRLSFQRCGFDVADYDDEQVCSAVLAEAAPRASSGSGMVPRAFARLRAHAGVRQQASGRRRN